MHINQNPSQSAPPNPLLYPTRPPHIRRARHHQPPPIPSLHLPNQRVIPLLDVPAFPIRDIDSVEDTREDYLVARVGLVPPALDGGEFGPDLGADERGYDQVVLLGGAEVGVDGRAGDNGFCGLWRCQRWR